MRLLSIFKGRGALISPRCLRLTICSGRSALAFTAASSGISRFAFRGWRRTG